jgi:hypothetical protein
MKERPILKVDFSGLSPTEDPCFLQYGQEAGEAEVWIWHLLNEKKSSCEAKQRGQRRDAELVQRIPT